MVLEQRYELHAKPSPILRFSVKKKKNLAKIPRVNHVQRVPKKFVSHFHVIKFKITRVEGKKERRKEEEIEANLVILGKRNSDSSTAKDGA